MPDKLPTWDETTEVLPTWDETSEVAETQPEDVPLLDQLGSMAGEIPGALHAFTTAAEPPIVGELARKAGAGVNAALTAPFSDQSMGELYDENIALQEAERAASAEEFPASTALGSAASYATVPGMGSGLSAIGKLGAAETADTALETGDPAAALTAGGLAIGTAGLLKGGGAAASKAISGTKAAADKAAEGATKLAKKALAKVNDDKVPDMDTVTLTKKALDLTRSGALMGGIEGVIYRAGKKHIPGMVKSMMGDKSTKGILKGASKIEKEVHPQSAFGAGARELEESAISKLTSREQALQTRLPGVDQPSKFAIGAGAGAPEFASTDLAEKVVDGETLSTLKKITTRAHYQKMQSDDKYRKRFNEMMKKEAEK